jgi:hypothetical protein
MRYNLGESWEVGLSEVKRDDSRERMKAFAATLPIQRRESCFVYFILAVETRRVKIGIAVDPIGRLYSLQTGCPEELRLLAYIPSDAPKRLEGDLHAKFRRHHVRGERYAMDFEVDHFIQHHASRDFDALDMATGRQTEQWEPDAAQKPDIPLRNREIPVFRGKGSKLARYKARRGIT